MFVVLESVVELECIDPLATHPDAIEAARSAATDILRYRTIRTILSILAADLLFCEEQQRQLAEPVR
jgi:hypothetical protein